MADKIQFNASFASIQTAITISGDGNGVRIKLDIPETDLLPFLHTLALRQTAFTVTIEVQEAQHGNATKEENTTTISRRTLKQRE